MKRKAELRFKLRTERIHQQILTNRKRHLYVEPIDHQTGWLTIETELVSTTIKHRSNGKLKQKDMTNSKSNNHGLVSKYIFCDLVKPIYLKDVPAIVEDFKQGKPIQSIKYSEWADFVRTKRSASQQMCSSKNFLFASSLKNSTFTSRIIKSVTSLLGSYH